MEGRVRILGLVAVGCATMMLSAGPWSAPHVGAQSPSWQVQKWCVSFHEVHPSLTVDEARQRGAPAGYRVYSSDVKGHDLLLREEPVLHGGEMADAQAGFDQLTNQPIVTFRFNAAGADKFASFTRNNIGCVMAILVDGRVVTAPVIRTPILGGVSQISGNFTSASAAQLAARIRSGTCVEFSRLPAPGQSGTG
jgi:preprotein translocase subunit SecD